MYVDLACKSQITPEWGSGGIYEAMLEQFIAELKRSFRSAQMIGKKSAVLQYAWVDFILLRSSATSTKGLLSASLSLVVFVQCLDASIVKWLGSARKSGCDHDSSSRRI